MPVIPKELATTRVPALVGPTAIAYIKDLQWVESPDRLFQDLVQETVIRTTNRVVLDPRQSALDPGLHLTGTLSRFGYDAQEGAVIVRYDACPVDAPAAPRVETRRFEAREPADGTARDGRPGAQRRRQPGRRRSRALGGWLKLSPFVLSGGRRPSSKGAGTTVLPSPFDFAQDERRVALTPDSCLPARTRPC